MNNIRSKIDENNPDNRDSHSTEEKGEDDDLSPESLLLNLKNQRMKYNAIVDYTVLLTAERDTIQQRLEESDRELSRENARKRGNGGDPPRAKKDEKILPKATVQQVAHFLALHSRSVERCLPYQLFILSSVLNIIVTSACVRVSVCTFDSCLLSCPHTDAVYGIA